MSLTTWNCIGIIILIMDGIWIGFYYYYATVKIYNYRETIWERHSKGNLLQEEYQYLGYLWIRKKNGGYFLRIPEQMIENSVTTKYKIISQTMFHTLRKGEKIDINFADQYDIIVGIEAEITVKNYIATSHRL